MHISSSNGITYQTPNTVALINPLPNIIIRAVGTATDSIALPVQVYGQVGVAP